CRPDRGGGVIAAEDFCGGPGCALVADELPAEIVGRIGEPGADVGDHLGGAAEGEVAGGGGAKARSADGCVEGAGGSGREGVGGGGGGVVEAIEPGGVVGGRRHPTAAGAVGSSLSPILKHAMEAHGAIAVGFLGGQPRRTP